MAGCECAPLALAGELVLDVVDGVAGSGAVEAVLGAGELVAEDLVVLVVADGVYNNLLLVVCDLVDDVLGLAVAAAEVLVCGDALILDLDTIRRRCQQRAGIPETGNAGVDSPRCELRDTVVSK